MPPPAESPKEKKQPSVRRFASSEVDVILGKRRPRAVVILFGWMGAQRAHLKKYAKLYHDRDCCTVTACATPLALLSHDVASLGSVAVTACREAAMIIRRGEMSEMGYGIVPLVVHAFSNGGAFVVEEMEHIIREVVGDECLGEMSEGSTATMMAMSTRSMRSFNKSQRNLMVDLNQDEDEIIVDTSSASDSVECSTQSSMKKLRTACESDEKGRNWVKSLTPTSNGWEISDPLLSPTLNEHGSDSLQQITTSFQTAVETILGDDEDTAPSSEAARVIISPPPMRPTSSKLLRNSERSGSKRRKKKPPKVKRTDQERGALNSSSASRPSYNPEERAYNLDLALVASRLRSGCVIYDSAPCFLTISSALEASNLGIPNPFVRCMLQTAALSTVLCKCTTNICCSRGKDRAKEFWRHMETSTLTNRQAYVYSTVDPAMDCQKVEELIQFRRQRMGNEVVALRFEDSTHVVHMREHKREYEALIDAQLDAITPDEDLDKDAWSSDEDEGESES